MMLVETDAWEDFKRYVRSGVVGYGLDMGVKVDVDFDAGKQAGRGESCALTRRMLGRGYNVNVVLGSGTLLQLSDGRSVYTEQEIASLALAAWHEVRGHVVQGLEMREADVAACDVDMALDKFDHFCNRGRYAVKYAWDVTEVDAELSAVDAAVGTCEGYFGDEDACGVDWGDAVVDVLRERSGVKALAVAPHGAGLTTVGGFKRDMRVHLSQCREGAVVPFASDTGLTYDARPPHAAFPGDEVYGHLLHTAGDAFVERWLGADDMERNRLGLAASMAAGTGGFRRYEASVPYAGELVDGATLELASPLVVPVERSVWDVTTASDRRQMLSYMLDRGATFFGVEDVPGGAWRHSLDAETGLVSVPAGGIVKRGAETRVRGVDDGALDGALDLLRSGVLGLRDTGRLAMPLSAMPFGVGVPGDDMGNGLASDGIEQGSSLGES